MSRDSGSVWGLAVGVAESGETFCSLGVVDTCAGGGGCGLRDFFNEACSQGVSQNSCERVWEGSLCIVVFVAATTLVL